MSAFPLYDELKRSTEAVPERVKLCAMINSLEQREHLDILFALIFHHSLLDSSSSSTQRTIPYSGRLVSRDRGLRFEIDRLPPSLVEILGRYIATLTN